MKSMVFQIGSTRTTRAFGPSGGPPGPTDKMFSRFWKENSAHNNTGEEFCSIKLFCEIKKLGRLLNFTGATGFMGWYDEIGAKGSSGTTGSVEMSYLKVSLIVDLTSTFMYCCLTKIKWTIKCYTIYFIILIRLFFFFNVGLHSRRTLILENKKNPQKLQPNWT